jgi:alginate O-acetyltransferase complex protein AlgI
VLFNSFTYLVFLPIVVAIYWAIPARFRTWLLLLASYLFYMNWIPGYGLLIVFLTLVNYGLGLIIAKATMRKRLILSLGLCFNIGALCFFKYATFVAENVWATIIGSSQLLHAIAPSVPVSNLDKPVVNVLLPLGISFFTFEFIHYIVDVYKGSAPIGNLKNFALFAAFFPSQIAGPIKRYQDFMVQLDHPKTFRQADFRGGIFLILQGLYKKIVLGDNLGLIVNYGFTHATTLGRLDAWIAVVGFTFQIFFDFAGYTDIGRGSAMLLGYKVPANFNWPFLASNLTEFWHRWHMSLSSWLRDYLFFPMGGSRVSPWKLRRNLMITMILGGLWHGAAWHYVLWGAFHGLGLVISKDWHDFISRFKTLSKWRPTKIWHCLGVVYTLIFLFIAGTLFRADTLNDVWLMLATMIPGLPLTDRNHELVQMFWQSTVSISILAYCLFLAARSKFVSLENDTIVGIKQVRQLWENYAPVRYVAYACMGILILGFAPSKMSPFIYFQF